MKITNKTYRKKHSQSTGGSGSISSSGGVTLIACLVLFAVVAAAMLYLNPWSSSATEMPQASIEISQNSFIPPTMTIAAGSQVTWVNNDDTPHQIASQQLIGPKSPEPIAKGESYSYIFETAGTYNYYDLLGAQILIGTIIVE